jgi:hypothetical protein
MLRRIGFTGLELEPALQAYTGQQAEKPSLTTTIYASTFYQSRTSVTHIAIGTLARRLNPAGFLCAVALSQGTTLNEPNHLSEAVPWQR